MHISINHHHNHLKSSSAHKENITSMLETNLMPQTSIKHTENAREKGREHLPLDMLSLSRRTQDQAGLEGPGSCSSLLGLISSEIERKTLGENEFGNG